MMEKWDAVALGEIMLRLSPLGNGRLAEADRLQNHAGGSESVSYTHLPVLFT